jgi:capsular exopolysaccharide synthesis family protein
MEKDNGYVNNVNIEAEQTGVNIKEILLKYFHYSWLFVLTVALSLSIAWLYLRYTKPLYSVTSTLLIRNDNSGRGAGGMSTQSMFTDIDLFQANTNKQNEMLILNSRTLMERVVKSLGLQKEYSVVGTVKTTDIFPEQPFELNVISITDSSKPFSLALDFNDQWTGFKLVGSKIEVLFGEEFQTTFGKFKLTRRISPYSDLPFRHFIVKWRPLFEASTYYLQGLEVKPANDLSNVLMLTKVSENPRLSTAILNELMNQYNAAAIEDKNEINRKILSFITDRLGLVESQLDSVEGNLQKFRTSRQVIDMDVQSGMYFDNISQLNETQRGQEVQLQVAQLLEDYLNQPSNRSSLVPSTLGLNDPTLVELTAAYNKLVGQRNIELQTGATVNNPIVKNLDTNIEEARLKMLQSVANIKRVFQQNINNINAKSGAIKKEITSIPERERLAREKARQQEIKQNLYLYLMQKREEAEIAQASTIASSRILDTALPLFNKVNPIPLKVYGIAILIGLFLPILIIYLKELLNDKVTTRADVTKATNAPVLGEIGHSEEGRVLLFPESSRTVVAEQMRILRSNLRFVLADKFENPTILVSSSFSGEGKSFISTNLGATLAISGKRTIILEFDLRKPKILSGLGLAKGHGLTNYLVGSARIEELPQAVPQVDGLYVIPCGPVPPNPSEILLIPKIQELFTWLKLNFDAIVIDTAPVGLVSDSFTLSQYADATIYVVRQRYTFKRQLSFVEELYEQHRLPNIGLLINDVIAKGSKGYYGYGAGKYGYGYGYYGYKDESGYFVGNKKAKNGIMAKLKKSFLG